MTDRKDPKDLPMQIAGIDWRGLIKGDTIPAEKISEMWDILYGETRTRDERFVSQAVKNWLDRALRSIGKEMVLKESKGKIVVLTDAQAVGYLDAQADSGIRKHKNSTRRMFTAIDADNLTSYQRNELENNQAKHALIASSALGAKKQAVNLLKQGAKLPKLTPPEDD